MGGAIHYFLSWIDGAIHCTRHDYLYPPDSPSMDQQPWILDVLRCPLSGESLTWADAELLAELNQRVAAGDLFDRGGDLIQQPFDSALVNASRQWLYRVSNDLADFLPGHAVQL